MFVPEERPIAERLKEANAKVKSLASSRDQILGDARVEEQKLKTAYEALAQLGIEGAEKFTASELQKLADERKAKLAEKVQLIEGHLAKGEQLMQEYRELQET